MTMVLTRTRPARAPLPLNLPLTLALGAAVLCFAHALGVLPVWLMRLPEALVPPLAALLDAVFDFIQNDLGLIHVTRGFAGLLELPLDATANLLYGKRRWPFLGPIPWSVVAVAMTCLGYALAGGGWRRWPGGPACGRR